MKKILYLLLTLPLFLAGCLENDVRPHDELPNNGSTNTTSTEMTSQRTENNDIFSTVADAVSRKVGMTCTYTDEDGEKMVVDFLGRQFLIRKETEDSEKLRSIAKDNKMYIWGEGQAEGLLIDFATAQNTERESLEMRGKPINSLDDVIGVLEAERENCKPNDIEEAQFVLPGGVVFKED